MSNIAIIDRPTARPALHLVPDLPDEAPAAPPAEANLPTGATPRGFALYVGFDEQKAAASGISLGRIVEELRRTLAAVAPDAETYATVALAPAGAGGRDVDVVRRALREPAAVARTAPEPEPEEQGRTVTGVLVDISRKRVVIDGEQAGLTYKEFELLQYLVLREGRTIERTELVSSLWRGQDDEDAPGERTIDVHVRRLRGKLGDFQEIVRTVRGVGYRFDRHADVVIHYGHGTPSPDRF